MANTPVLALPLLAAAQAQKHVTMNEALFLIDALTQIAVKEQGRNAPPDQPVAGDRYLIGTTPTGGFAGKAGMLAAFDGNGWVYTTLRAGFIFFVMSESRLYVFDGNSLKALKDIVGLPDSFPRLGIGTGSDPNNTLSVKGTSALYAALGSGEGGSGDFRLTLNKSAAGNILSQLYQSNWSGRAETGLTGDDQYRIKVSADGSTWSEALVVDNSNGAVRLPCGLSQIGGGGLGFRNLIINADCAIAQRGSGPFTLSGAGPIPCFDRWRMFGSAGVAASFARSPININFAGSLSGSFYSTFTVTAATATARASLETRLDQFFPLVGRRVTLSFRYRSNAPLSVALTQNFGAGGSPPATLTLASALPTSSNWRVFSFTTSVASLLGKAVGSFPFIAVQFIAAQPVIFDCAELQLEEGFQTPFERRPPSYELTLCRRFFRRSAVALNATDLALEMRSPPIASGTGPFDYEAEFEAAS